MDNLITLYQQRLNLQSGTFTRIDHDDGVGIVYKVMQPGGPQLILKICPRTQDYLREVYFLKFFAVKLSVPRIVELIEPETNINGAILMDCLPGIPLTEVNDELAYEIGSHLARIHLNRVQAYGDLTQPQHLNADPRVNFTMKFEEGLAECRTHLPKALLEKCQHYYETHLNLLVSVDGPCIIHRDFRPGNVIVCDGKLQGIIDWASGRASFAEEDFCPVEHGEWPINPNIKESFLAGYASIRPLPDIKAIMPLLRLNRAIAIIGFTIKGRTWESSNAQVYQFNRQFIESFI